MHSYDIQYGGAVCMVHSYAMIHTQGMYSMYIYAIACLRTSGMHQHDVLHACIIAITEHAPREHGMYLCYVQHTT